MIHLPKPNPYIAGQWLKRAGGCFPHVPFLVLPTSTPTILDIAMYTWSRYVQTWEERLITECDPTMVEVVCGNCGKLLGEHTVSGACLFHSTKFEPARLSKPATHVIYERCCGPIRYLFPAERLSEYLQALLRRLAGPHYDEP